MLAVPYVEVRQCYLFPATLQHLDFLREQVSGIESRMLKARGGRGVIVALRGASFLE